MHWIFLVLISAATHPLRDLTLKGARHPVSSYVGVSLIWVILAAVQTVVSGQGLTLPPEVWPYVIISAAGLIFYYYGTLAALRRGNLSVYYPIIRSSPVAIVAASWLLFDQSYSWAALAGIALVILGSLMIQKPTGGMMDDPKAFALACLAMLGSAAYSMSDAQAMQHVSAAPFLFYSYAVMTPFLAGIRLWEARGHSAPIGELIQGWVQMPGKILFAGITSYLSYLLILAAFSGGAEAAVVSAVRQASIPISVILAAVHLRETRLMQRLAWASLIAVGILAIAAAQ